MKSISVITAMALVLLPTSPLHGQNPLSSAITGPPPFTTVQITPSLGGCPSTTGFHAVSWSTGTSSSTVSQVLTINKLLDDCSVPLFSFVVQNTAVTTLLLTEHDGSTNQPLMTLKLEKAAAVDYKLMSDPSSASLTEQLTFDYEKITFTNQTTGQHFCFDKTTRMPC
jgi:type VI protein secretion system component Hcp